MSDFVKYEVIVEYYPKHTYNADGKVTGYTVEMEKFYTVEKPDIDAIKLTRGAYRVTCGIVYQKSHLLG